MGIFPLHLSILNAESLEGATLCTSLETHLDKSIRQESLKACNFPGHMGDTTLLMEDSCKAA